MHFFVKIFCHIKKKQYLCNVNDTKEFKTHFTYSRLGIIHN